MSGPGDPAWNMAVDEALLLRCAEGASPPTLRFYTWSPPTVSLGRCQEVDAEIDREACRRLGVAWVRRPTGGRAVFHGCDLTYSVVAPAALLPGGVLDVYRRLAAGLVAGLRRLGVAAELVGRPGRVTAPRRSGAGLAGAGPCFLAPSWWEVAVAGRKLVGSAQARRRGAVLQHGSVPLEPWAGPFCAVLRAAGEAARRQARRALERSTTHLAAVLGRTPAPEEVAAALAAGFAEALGVELVEAGLAAAEAEAARRLVVERHLPERGGPAGEKPAGRSPRRRGTEGLPRREPGAERICRRGRESPGVPTFLARLRGP